MSTAVSEGTSGGLRVYSGVTVPAFGGEDVKPLENTAYEIRAESGQLIETVQNSYGTRAGDRPPVVTLATGSYRILAWSAQRGLVTVPITIANGRVTTVRFDAAKK